MTASSDLSRAIAATQALLTAVPSPMKVEIMAGSMDRFVQKMEDDMGLQPSKLPAVASHFMGVRVVENKLLPGNVIAIKVNDAVTQVIRFD